MKKHLFFILALLSLVNLDLHAKGESFLFGNADELRIMVNNRILAKVNGKAISVIDLMKKMDMLFYNQFPEYTSSTEARFQFYQANWKHVLTEMVDKELIMADATENKLQVNHGDVRQEMERMFGPNIITNLDKVGLTFEEASKMVLADITIRRMAYIRVHSKALKKVTPQMIRDYYDEYSKDNIRDKEWIYHVISVRNKDAALASETANEAYKLLIEKTPMDKLQNVLVEKYPNSIFANINISEEYRHKEKEISDAFKQTLASLQVENFSQPLAQKSRSDNTTVYRIFYLKEIIPGGVIPFQEIEAQLKDQILEKIIDEETDAYLKKLRQHFDVQDRHFQNMLTDDFQPFSLQ